MKFIFDENTSQHVTKLMQQLGADVCHVIEEFEAGIKDSELLPEIARRDLILITADFNMNRSTGRHGHRALLLSSQVKALFLPGQFTKWSAWDRAVWTLRYWRHIESQMVKIGNASLIRITDNGNLKPID